MDLYLILLQVCVHYITVNAVCLQSYCIIIFAYFPLTIYVFVYFKFGIYWRNNELERVFKRPKKNSHKVRKN